MIFLLAVLLATAASASPAPAVLVAAVPATPLVVVPPDPLSMWLPLAAAALGSLSAWIKTLTPSTGFWHTNIGHLVLTFAGFVLGGMLGVVQSGSITKQALIIALIAATSSFLSALTPNGTLGKGEMK